MKKLTILAENAYVQKSTELINELAKNGNLFQVHELLTKVMLSYLKTSKNSCDEDEIEIFQEFHYVLYARAVNAAPEFIEKSLRRLCELNNFQLLMRMVHHSTTRFLNESNNSFPKETIEDYLCFLELLYQQE